jgi:hypothetical protein
MTGKRGKLQEPSWLWVGVIGQPLPLLSIFLLLLGDPPGRSGCSPPSKTISKSRTTAGTNVCSGTELLNTRPPTVAVRPHYGKSADGQKGKGKITYKGRNNLLAHGPAGLGFGLKRGLELN